MPLEDEIESAQRNVRTDGYSMSIGEIVTMYQNDEIIIRPPFQRLFRWTVGQKSKFIESLLMGIPIPPIFVFETEEGVWELIDGLQRTSTLLEFMGLLKSAEGKPAAPSYLEGTRYLPSLHNCVWELTTKIEDLPLEQQVPFTKAQQLSIRRAKLGVQILKRPSDPETKYDLFQRLNRGGTTATAQEVRNCVVIMISQLFFDAIQDMAHFGDYLALAHISEIGEQRQRDVEMVMRFLVFVSYDYDNSLDVEEYLDTRILDLAEGARPLDALTTQFKGTFRLLRQSLGDQALQKWNDATQSFGGRVGQVALEVVAAGVGYNLEAILARHDPQAYVAGRVKDFWTSENGAAFTAAGIRGTQRLSETVALGRKWFAE